jgi:hypothetical protein
MWLAGARTRDICAVLGVQADSIAKRRRKLGLPPRSPENKWGGNKKADLPPLPDGIEIPKPDDGFGLGLERQLVDETDKADDLFAAALKRSKARESFADGEVRTVAFGRVGRRSTHVAGASSIVEAA